MRDHIVVIDLISADIIMSTITCIGNIGHLSRGLRLISARAWNYADRAVQRHYFWNVSIAAGTGVG